MFFALQTKEINTRVELSRALWNSQSALVSIRILPDLVSSSPFPSHLPLFFVLEPPKRDLGTRSHITVESTDGRDICQNINKYVHIKLQPTATISWSVTFIGKTEIVAG